MAKCSSCGYEEPVGGLKVAEQKPGQHFLFCEFCLGSFNALLDKHKRTSKEALGLYRAITWMLNHNRKMMTQCLRPHPEVSGYNNDSSGSQFWPANCEDDQWPQNKSNTDLQS